MESMDYLSAMRVFVRVVERGSMSAAARDLNIGQPAVSERIERLELRLRTQLLRRSTRAVSVTDTGSVFYERCKLAIQAADDALFGINDEAALRGTLRIAAPHGLGEILLPPILLRLRDRHPGLKIELILNDRVVDPIAEGVDISLRLGDHGEGSFIARKLGEISRVLVAAPSYLERKGEPRKPSDLVQHDFARVSGLFNTEKLPLNGGEGRAVAYPVDTVLSVSHWRPLHAILLGGGAIGVLQEHVCFRDLAAGRLKRILPSFAVPSLPLHALYSPTKPTAARVGLLLSMLETAVSADASCGTVSTDLAYGQNLPP
jgi:DNA-binding transcriptional LysR family regulator